MFDEREREKKRVRLQKDGRENKKIKLNKSRVSKRLNMAVINFNFLHLKQKSNNKKMTVCTFNNNILN